MIKQFYYISGITLIRGSNCIFSSVLAPMSNQDLTHTAQEPSLIELSSTPSCHFPGKLLKGVAVSTGFVH